MAECIFCMIASKPMNSRVIYEDRDAVAFLDITPRSKGMCLVITKKHLTNFTEDMELSKRLFETSLIVGEKIKKALNPLTIFMSVLPSQVPHIHIRVYPVYEKQIPLMENNPINMNDAEMDDIARKIRNANIELKRREVYEEEIKKPVEIKEERVERIPEKNDDGWNKRNFEVA